MIFCANFYSMPVLVLGTLPLRRVAVLKRRCCPPDQQHRGQLNQEMELESWEALCVTVESSEISDFYVGETVGAS